jgi:CheY-like chemotaxis protein
MATEPSHHRLERSDDGPAKARVLLVEDDVLLREELASLLERSGFEVVGQTGDSGWILPLVRDLRPDLVVVDIRMPPTNTTTIADQGLKGKPAPDTFLAGARCVGVDPPQAAVFEDALAGVAACRTGGFGFVVGVNRAGQADALRAHGADIVVSDLADLLDAPNAQAAR